MGLLKLLSHKKPSEVGSRQANQASSSGTSHPSKGVYTSPVAPSSVLDEVRPRYRDHNDHHDHHTHDLDIDHAEHNSRPLPHLPRSCKDPEMPTRQPSVLSATKITSTSRLPVGPVKLKNDHHHIRSPLSYATPSALQHTQALGLMESFPSRRDSISASLLLDDPIPASTMHLRAFIDILDAQSEIRPSDFRSRVRAAGARDFGEDVAERNLGQNGTDLSSEAVQDFYARRVTTRGGGGITLDARQPARKSDDGLGARKSRSMTGLSFNFQLNDTTPPPPPPQTTNEAAAHRQSITGFPSSTPPSIRSNRTLRERRSRPPSMIKTDLRPDTTASNALGLTPPAIPDHPPPISPPTLRDSVMLTKEKQASSSPLSRTDPDMAVCEIGIAQSRYDDDLSSCAPSSPCLPRSNGTAAAAAPSCIVDDYSTPHALMSTTPLVSRMQLDDSQTPSAPHGMRRHWSFSSTTPTTASTSSSNPFSYHRPQSRHTAGTSIEEAPGVIYPLSRRGSFESATGAAGPKACSSSSSIILDTRALLPITLAHQSSSSEQTTTYPGSEFTLDDYLSSDDVDSIYSSACTCDPIDIDGPMPGFLKPRIPPPPPSTRPTTTTCADDVTAGLLPSSEASYDEDGHLVLLPGILLSESVPETGIATAIPLPGHQLLSAVTARPPSMITITARQDRARHSHANHPAFDRSRSRHGGSLSFGNPAGRSAFDFSDSDESGDDDAGDNDGNADDDDDTKHDDGVGGEQDRTDLVSGMRGTRRISALGTSPIEDADVNDKVDAKSGAKLREDAKMRSRGVGAAGLPAWRRGMVMADVYGGGEYDETSCFF